MARPKTPQDPFLWFDCSPEVIRLVVMMYVRYPLSLRNVEDLLFESGIDICHETVRLWWNRFGPMFAGEIRRKRVQGYCQSNLKTRWLRTSHIGLSGMAGGRVQGATSTWNAAAAEISSLRTLTKSTSDNAYQSDIPLSMRSMMECLDKAAEM